jgi:hypothetical protein
MFYAWGLHHCCGKKYNLHPMANLLQQPFPTFTPNRRGVIVCLASGGCVFLVLFVFKAFGMAYLPTATRFWHASIFSLATVVVSSLNAVLLPLLLPSLFREEKWTVAKEVVFFIWVIVCVGAVNLLINHWLYGNQGNWENLLTSIGITAAVAVLPVTISILVKQQSLLRRFSTEAKQIENSLFTPAPIPIDRPILPVDTPLVPEPVPLAFIELTGENTQDKLQLPIDDLLYIHAADNYVKIFYTLTGEVQSSILRSPLRKMEETLAAYPQFYRCHRTYLVNLEKVIHISGNAQGFKLHLHGTTDLIPVSRSLNAVIADKLAAFKTH